MGTAFKGDDECDAVDRGLRDAVVEFDSGLSRYAAHVGFRTFQLGKQTLDVSMLGVDIGMQSLEVVNTTLGIVHGRSFFKGYEISLMSRYTSRFVSDTGGGNGIHRWHIL